MIPTNIDVPPHTQTKEESHLQQWFKKETEQNIPDEQHAVFLAGTLTSQDTNKIIRAAENPDSEDSPTVTFGKIYFIICTNLGMSKNMTPQDDKDFEAPSEISSQLCKIGSTNENRSVVNSTITTTHLLPYPDGTTNQNTLACSNKITMAHGCAVTEKTDVRICQSQQGQESEQIFKCTSQIQTVHQIKSPDVQSQLSFHEAAASKLTSGNDSLQTPTGDEAQPQKIRIQMAGMPITGKDSISYQTDVTSLDNLQDLDQEKERVVNSETDTLIDHKAIQVSESKTIHHSESTSNIHFKQNKECVDDETSIYDPIITGHISTEKEPQFLVKEETVVKSQEIVVNSETDTLTDRKTHISESKTIHHSESTTNIHLIVKPNEERVDDKTSIYDQVIAGHISTERLPQFEIVVNSESDMLTDHKTIQVSESKTIQVSESKTIHHSESTSNIHLILKQNEECVDDKTSIYDPFIAGHISREREQQFLLKEETVIKSHEIVVNSETDTFTDHTTIQVPESKTIHHSESTSNIHLIGQQNEECVDEKTSLYDPVIAGHISTEREPQFLVSKETVLKSQEMEKEKTYRGETTMLNTESSEQRSCSQITEISDVWEDIQLFGEFRLQRKKSTNITNINRSSHFQHREESYLLQQSKPSEESISDKKCAVFLAGTLSSHELNNIIRAAENTDAEVSPTVTFSKIYFITSTDLEMLQIMRPPNNAGFEGLPKNSIHLCTQIDNSTTEDTSFVNETTTNIHSTVAISNMELADENSIYKDNVSYGVAVLDAIKVTGIPTVNENPKDHNGEGVGIEASKDNSKSEVQTEVTRTDQVELKATESATTEIVKTGYGMYQTLKQTQTEQFQQASGSPTVEDKEFSEMASENLSEEAAAHMLTSRPQAQILGKSKDLDIVSNIRATTIVTTDSISHETDSMRLTVQHPDVQLSNEVLTSKTDKYTDPMTDKAKKSANSNHFQEGKSKCLHIQQNEASSDDKASSTVVITQISTEKDLQIPVKEYNILATEKIKEEEKNQARGIKFNQTTESTEIWETLQGFGEFRLQRKVTKHYSEVCRLSQTGQKEESQLEKSETPIRSHDTSHTQHAVFMAGILDINESDKIFKAVANQHAEVLPPVTFKKILSILPTDQEVVQRMT
ncbi:hypothetical protein SUGI_0721070 [Cryptomeria japonica]|nr:hypothetical protein SUGI_0721070 [Cryptomeria japonica]